MSRGSRPICPRCDVQMTVQHIFDDCPRFATTRTRGLPFLPTSLPLHRLFSILGDSPTLCWDRVISFLRQTSLLSISFIHPPPLSPFSVPLTHPSVVLPIPHLRTHQPEKELLPPYPFLTSLVASTNPKDSFISKLIMGEAFFFPHFWKFNFYFFFSSQEFVFYFIVFPFYFHLSFVPFVY